MPGKAGIQVKRGNMQSQNTEDIVEYRTEAQKAEAQIDKFFANNFLQNEIAELKKHLPSVIAYLIASYLLRDLTNFLCTATQRPLENPVNIFQTQLDERFLYEATLIDAMVAQRYFEPLGMKQSNSYLHIQRYPGIKNIMDTLYRYVFDFKNQPSNKEVWETIKDVDEKFYPIRQLKKLIMGDEKNPTPEKLEKCLEKITRENVLLCLNTKPEPLVFNQPMKMAAMLLATFFAVVQCGLTFYMIGFSIPKLFLMLGYFLNQSQINGACLHYLPRNTSTMFRGRLDDSLSGGLFFGAFIGLLNNLLFEKHHPYRIASNLEKAVEGIARGYPYFLMWNNHIRNSNRPWDFSAVKALMVISLAGVFYSCAKYSGSMLERFGVLLLSMIPVMNIITVSYNWSPSGKISPFIKETNDPFSQNRAKIVGRLGAACTVIVDVLVAALVTQEIIPLAIVFFTSILFATFAERMTAGFKRYALFSVPPEFKSEEIQNEFNSDSKNEINSGLRMRNTISSS